LTSKIVLENLRNKPIRSLLSVLLIAVPVTLILTLVGLSRGMLEDAQTRTRAIGADLIVRAPGSTAFSPGQMSEGVVRAVQKLPHVKVALGVLNKPIETITLGAAGIDLAKFTQMSGGVRLREGATFQGKYDIMVDEFYAAEKKLRAGQSIRLKAFNRDFRVSGIYANGLLAHVIMPLETLQELNGTSNTVTQVYVKLDNPANTASLIKTMKADEAWSAYPVLSMDELVALYSMNNMPGLNAFVWVIVGVGVVIGFAVMCLSMYMVVLQRTREIGILKSLGGSNAFILGLIMIEAVIMAFAGTALGIGMSYGSLWLIRTLVPASIQMVIVYEWWPISLGITLVGAGLGALYPGLTAARHDPIEALAYE
jgi:putative ABC transport system permease protein